MNVSIEYFIVIMYWFICGMFDWSEFGEGMLYLYFMFSLFLSWLFYDNYNYFIECKFVGVILLCIYGCGYYVKFEILLI